MKCGSYQQGKLWVQGKTTIYIANWDSSSTQ